MPSSPRHRPRPAGGPVRLRRRPVPPPRSARPARRALSAGRAPGHAAGGPGRGCQYPGRGGRVHGRPPGLVPLVAAPGRDRADRRHLPSARASAGARNGHEGRPAAAGRHLPARPAGADPGPGRQGLTSVGRPCRGHAAPAPGERLPGAGGADCTCHGLGQRLAAPSWCGRG